MTGIVSDHNNTFQSNNFCDHVNEYLSDCSHHCASMLAKVLQGWLMTTHQIYSSGMTYMHVWMKIILKESVKKVHVIEKSSSCKCFFGMKHDNNVMNINLLGHLFLKDVVKKLK